jgi:hypothetical protein
MAWSSRQNKAIWRDPVTVAATLIINNSGFIDEFVQPPPAPARGARLYILTPEYHAGKYIVYIKFSDGNNQIFWEWEADPIA